MRCFTVTMRAVTLGLGALLTLPVSPVLAADLYVPSPQFATIQGALDVAQPGDVVHVAPGTYDEHLSIDRPGITVEGVDRGTVLATAAGQEVVRINAHGPQAVVLTGLTITHTGGGNGVQLRLGLPEAMHSTALTLTNTTVTGCGGAGLSAFGNVQLTMSQCSMEHNGTGMWVGSYTKGLMDVTLELVDLTYNSTAGLASAMCSRIHASGGFIENNGEAGVRLGGQEVTELTNCELNNNGTYGMWLAGSDTTTLTNCIIDGHTQAGLFHWGNAVTMTGGSVSRSRVGVQCGRVVHLTNVSVSDNETGFSVGGAGASLELTDCQVFGNTANAVHAWNCDALRMTRCHVWDNGGHGAVGTGVQTCDIDECVIRENGNAGCYLAPVFDGDVQNCDISENATAGIVCWGGAPRITNNTIRSNYQAIVNWVWWGTNPFASTAADDVLAQPTITGNNILENSGGAVLAVDTAPANMATLVEDNTFGPLNGPFWVRQEWQGLMRVVQGGTAVAGAQVTVVDARGNSVAWGTTNAEGYAPASYGPETAWLTFRDYEVDAQGVRRDYTPHMVTATGLGSGPVRRVAYPWDGTHKTTGSDIDGRYQVAVIDLDEPLVVTSLADHGVGTLRDRIELANLSGGHDTITFGVEGAVALLSPLPDVVDFDGLDLYGQGVTLRGQGPDSFPGLRLASPGNIVRQLCLGAFSTAIEIAGPDAADNGVDNCLVGCDSASLLPNGEGIAVVGAPGATLTNTIVTDARQAGIVLADAPRAQVIECVAARNGTHGLEITGAASTHALVDASWVGVWPETASPRPPDWLAALPGGNESHGVLLRDGAAHCVVIGDTQANVIGGNGGAGVCLASTAGIGNTITSNSFLGNAGLWVDLGGDGPTPNDRLDEDSGPNGLQNHPALLWATSTRVGGLLHSTPNSSFVVNLWSGNQLLYGDAQSCVVTTDANGNAAFVGTNPSGPADGEKATATATDLEGSTSEFSDPVLVGAGAPVPVAADDEYVAQGGGALTVPGPGVLANDASVEGGPLTAEVETPPAHGTLTPNGDGGFTYTPTPGWGGVDSFAYRARENGSLLSNVATCAVTVSGDGDGVPDAVEDGAPNGGDGNNDGVPDSQQANVASLPNAVDGAYVTLVSPAGTSLAGVAAINNPSPDDAPEGIEFPAGFVEFRVTGLESGGAATVELLLDPDHMPNTYYKYGPTLDDPGPHWYEFLYDETTGADILEEGVVLHFVDGGRGDDDLAANGEVVEPGGPATAPGPEVASLSAPYEPRPVDSVVSVSAGFTDAETDDAHTAAWEWGDGTTSAGVVSEPQDDAPGQVTGEHAYTAAGVYTARVTVVDQHGIADSMVFRYVVIYDPEGGFVTGGGWITSPAGAYAANPSLAGKATFGFNSKYKKGASTPGGSTEFQFRTAGITFRSTSYDWLVVAGARAKYKGSGTINGSGDYGFMLTAVDGQVSGGGGQDKFRIKIWDRTNGDAVAYDNQMGEADDSSAATVLGGGSIVIHRGDRAAAAGNAVVTSLTVLPTTVGTQLTFTLSGAANVTAAVLNLAGRPVRTLCAGRACEAGTNALLWNAQSDAGLRVPNGTYLVRVTARTDSGATFHAVRTVALR